MLVGGDSRNDRCMACTCMQVSRRSPAHRGRETTCLPTRVIRRRRPRLCTGSGAGAVLPTANSSGASAPSTLGALSPAQSLPTCQDSRATTAPAGPLGSRPFPRSAGAPGGRRTRLNQELTLFAPPAAAGSAANATTCSHTWPRRRLVRARDSVRRTQPITARPPGEAVTSTARLRHGLRGGAPRLAIGNPPAHPQCDESIPQHHRAASAIGRHNLDPPSHEPRCTKQKL